MGDLDFSRLIVGGSGDANRVDLAVFAGVGIFLLEDDLDLFAGETAAGQLGLERHEIVNENDLINLQIR